MWLPRASCLELKLVPLSAEPGAECCTLLHLQTLGRTALSTCSQGFCWWSRPGPPWCPSPSACLLCSRVPGPGPSPASPAHGAAQATGELLTVLTSYGRGGVTVYLNLTLAAVIATQAHPTSSLRVAWACTVSAVGQADRGSTPWAQPGITG